MKDDGDYRSASQEIPRFRLAWIFIIMSATGPYHELDESSPNNPIP
jgi:hypothetical protein